MMAAVVYLVQDLFFIARIRDVADQLGVTAVPAASADALPAAAHGARLVIVDLRRADALAALERLAADPAAAAVRSVGFVGHEQTDVMAAARERGCGTVLAKGKFASELPALIESCR
jgi:hypothetical protein